jgi:hypothetical protein
VSPWFWIYWLVAGALTLITLAAWYWFSKRHTRRMKMLLPDDVESNLELALTTSVSEYGQEEKATVKVTEL